MAIEFAPVISGEVEVQIESPRFFGAEGDTTQETLIVDEPLVITESEYSQLKQITRKVVNFIDSYDLQANADKIGVNLQTLETCADIDSYGGSTMRYGGLDLYQDPNMGFKVLEINPRVQAMGLQDFRQEYLGIRGEPQIIDHFIEWTQKEGFEKVALLGSRKNPFWRSYQRLADKLTAAEVSAIFCDSRNFIDRYRIGFRPELIVKLSNNNIFLSGEDSGELVEIIRGNSIPVVNSLASVYYGFRGFMEKLGEVTPEILPREVIFGNSVNDEELRNYPWIKLEAAGKNYVVNYKKLTKCGRNAILAIITRDYTLAESLLRDKNGGDANKIRNTIGYVRELPREEVVCIGQSSIEPRLATLNLDGVDTELKILHRVYWFKESSGEIEISLEGFGATHDQFERSKGKINAGSGV